MKDLRMALRAPLGSLYSSEIAMGGVCAGPGCKLYRRKAYFSSHCVSVLAKNTDVFDDVSSCCFGYHYCV